MRTPTPFILSISLALLLVTPTWAANYYQWDCEETVGLESNSSLVTTDPHGGLQCMQIDVIGDDSGNQPSGRTGGGGIAIGTMCDGGWLYYRWWMKFDAGFSWGDGTAKAKANRIMRETQTHPIPMTGYVHDQCVLVGECPHCAPASPDWCNDDGACIHYDFRTAAGTGWHEYIVALKKQDGVSGTDGEFHLYVDGQLIGAKEGFHWHDEDIEVLEAWGAWMTSPYFQMNGTSSDGGSIWFDDYSLDSEWNSLEYQNPQSVVPRVGIAPVSAPKGGTQYGYTITGRVVGSRTGLILVRPGLLVGELPR